MEQEKQEGQTMEVFEISVMVKDIEESMKKFKDLYGLVPYETYNVELRPGVFRGKEISGAKVKIAFYNFGPVRVELLQPAGGESIYQEWVNKHGIGVQHLGCRVADFKKQMEFLEKRGVKAAAIQQGSEFSPFKQNVYVDSEDLVGFHFEIVEPR